MQYVQWRVKGESWGNVMFALSVTSFQRPRSLPKVRMRDELIEFLIRGVRRNLMVVVWEGLDSR